MDISPTHAYLLEKTCTACLSTLSPDLSIQSSLIWYDFRAGQIRINTSRGSAKERNVQRSGQATLLIADPDDTDIYLTLRMRHVLTSAEGAVEHLDLLTRRAMGVAHWYGDVEPADAPGRDRRVILYFEPYRQYHP